MQKIHRILRVSRDEIASHTERLKEKRFPDKFAVSRGDYIRGKKGSYLESVNFHGESIQYLQISVIFLLYLLSLFLSCFSKLAFQSCSFRSQLIGNL